MGDFITLNSSFWPFLKSSTCLSHEIHDFSPLRSHLDTEFIRIRTKSSDSLGVSLMNSSERHSPGKAFPIGRVLSIGIGTFYREKFLFNRGNNGKYFPASWEVSLFLILEFGFQRAAGRNTLRLNLTIRQFFLFVKNIIGAFGLKEKGGNQGKRIMSPH